MNCGFDCFVYILPFSSHRTENVCFRYEIPPWTKKARMIKTHPRPLKKPPLQKKAPNSSLSSWNLRSIRWLWWWKLPTLPMKQTVPTSNFFSCVMLPLGMEPPAALVLKGSQFLSSDYPPIGYWFIIFIKLQMGACCMRPAINYENVLSSSVGADLRKGRMSES